jgi:hypothetical protein
MKTPTAASGWTPSCSDSNEKRATFSATRGDKPGSTDAFEVLSVP